jgi:hypothetical protein
MFEALSFLFETSRQWKCFVSDIFRGWVGVGDLMAEFNLSGIMKLLYFTEPRRTATFLRSSVIYYSGPLGIIQ